MKRLLMKIIRFILKYFENKSHCPPVIPPVIPPIPPVNHPDFILSENGISISTESNQKLTK